MRRISTRLVLSHMAVAAVAAVTTFVVVRALAPALFDASLRRSQQLGGQAGRGPGGAGAAGYGMALRDEFAHAVDQALAAGALAGTVVAAALGIVVALGLGRSLTRLREATRRIAAGDYAARVTLPAETELAAVAEDVNTLGASLAETEGRRVRLLGEVAHEMRTPLTVIDGYVEGMIDGILPADAESLAQVGAETRRLRRLSDDLSALSRAEEGRVALTRTPLDLGALARDAAERLRSQADDAGLTLEVAATDRVMVDADADRLAQVVTNLVGNAMRATPPGGWIRVGCTASGDTATLAVSDSGEGLAPDQLERVFERFHRVPGRRTVSSDCGSGIGLTIARGLARAHGGDLVAASAGRGRGATFTLTLPLLRG